jgi:hypothetical protein
MIISNWCKHVSKYERALLDEHFSMKSFYYMPSISRMLLHRRLKKREREEKEKDKKKRKENKKEKSVLKNTKKIQPQH